MKIDPPHAAGGGPDIVRLFGDPRARLAARAGVAILASAAAAMLVTLGAPVPAPAPRAGGPDVASAPDPTAGAPLGFGLARLVPAEAVAFVSIANVPEFLGRASETGLARALRDERVASFARDVVAGLPREASEVYAAGLLLARGLGPSLRGEAAAALLPVERQGATVAPDAVFLADVSGRAAGARSFMGTTLALSFVTGSIGTVRIAGVDAVVCRRGADTVAWCETDGLLAVATSEKALGRVLARRPAMKGAPPGIESIEAYRRGMARASLEGRVDYRAFVDVERLTDVLLGERAADFRAAYGVAGLRAATLVGRVDAEVREAVFLDARGASGAGGATSGIAGALGGAPVGRDAAKRMPAETIFAAFGTIDGSALAGDLSQVRSLSAFPRAAVIFLGLLGKESTKRILEGVRGEAAVAAWNEGRLGWFPRAAAVATVRDHDGTARALKDAWLSMAKRMRGRLLSRRGRWKGASSREVTVGYVDGPKVFLPTVGSPAYGLDGDALVAGTAATAVCGIIEETRGLAATDKFRSLLAKLPAERSAFVYLNVETLVERALEPMGPAVFDALFPGLAGRLDRGKFPPGEAVAQYLGPAGVSAAGAEGGIRVDAITPAGLGLAAFVAYALSGSDGPGARPSRTP